MQDFQPLVNIPERFRSGIQIHNLYGIYFTTIALPSGGGVIASSPSIISSFRVAMLRWLKAV